MSPFKVKSKILLTASHSFSQNKLGEIVKGDRYLNSYHLSTKRNLILTSTFNILQTEFTHKAKARKLHA